MPELEFVKLKLSMVVGVAKTLVMDVVVVALKRRDATRHATPVSTRAKLKSLLLPTLSRSSAVMK